MRTCETAFALLPTRRRSNNRVANARSKKIEMRFAHMKRILRLDRLRLRGLSGARDEVLLTATAQNLRRLVKFPCRLPPLATAACQAWLVGQALAPERRCRTSLCARAQQRPGQKTHGRKCIRALQQIRGKSGPKPDIVPCPLSAGGGYCRTSRHVRFGSRLCKNAK